MRPPILVIDPGPTESAWVLWDGCKLESFAKEPNEAVLERIKHSRGRTTACAIEQVTSYGMPVGAEVFDTVYWSGRFAEAYGAEGVQRVPRLKVKLHLCHDSRAKDGNIRQALIDRFGGKEKALGRKDSPGPLYGVSGDVWAALALAVTWWDQNAAEGLKAQPAPSEAA
jgi:hypothetical protein